MIIAPPPVTPSEMQWHPLSNTSLNESPTNRTTETLELAGCRLEGHLAWDALNDEEIAALQSWIAKLRGAANVFYCPHFYFAKPRGAVSGTPITATANQYGAVLNVKNLLPNKLAWRAGDWISIQDEPKIVVADCQANGLGDATLYFEPPLRKIVPQGTPIVWQLPRGIFRLKDDKQGAMPLRRDKPGKLKIQIVEAF